MSKNLLGFLVLFLATDMAAGGQQQDKDLETKAKAAITKQLRDPVSARFSDVRIKSVNGRSAVCGSVNAKNSAGVMTGPQPFVFDGQNANVLVLTNGPNNPTSFGPDVLALIFKRGSDNYAAFCGN